MKAYEATATIAAAPEVVWKIPLDGSSCTQWDSGVVGLEGTIALGERLKATSEVNPGRAFPVRVTEVAAPRSMRWSGGMLLGCSRASGRLRSALETTARTFGCPRSTADRCSG
jgi:hypothetical protein